jgi:hypothetical protein
MGERPEIGRTETRETQAKHAKCKWEKNGSLFSGIVELRSSIINSEILLAIR